MNLSLIRQQACPADIILTGGDSFISRLIKYAQKVQTPTGKPSNWSHVMLYVDTNTVWESTMDFEPYGTEEKRFDNGIQYNHLDIHEEVKYGMLIHFPFSDLQRQAILNLADMMARDGYTYPIIGLVGSVLSYWIFRGWASNPLQGKGQLYCSAAIQEVFAPFGIEFDKEHTARNTSPEMIFQFKMAGLQRWVV